MILKDAALLLADASYSLLLALKAQTESDAQGRHLLTATAQASVAQALLTAHIADALERVAAALERAHPEWVYEAQLEHQHAVQIQWGWEALGRLKDDPRYIVYRKAQPWGCPPLEPDAKAPQGGGE